MTRPAHEPQRAIDDLFSSYATTWDDVYRLNSVVARIYQRRQGLAMRWVDGLHLNHRAPVLEVGCGAGHATVALAHRGFRVAATDRVPAMLRLTQTRARAAGVAHAVKVTCGDAHALSFGDHTFQLVLGLGVVPWLYSPRAALAEMARVLQPGGFLIASADNRMRLTNLFDPRLSLCVGPARRYMRKIARLPRRAHDAPPRMHSPREMRTLLEAAGFTLLADTTCGFGPFTAFGYSVLGDRASRRLDAWLQRRAEAGVPALRGGGAHYVTLCSK